MKSEIVDRLKRFDAYPKTLDDFRVRTTSGAAVSIVSGVFIVFLFLSEFAFFLTTEVTTDLYVDTTRGEKLKINMDIIFPQMPCAYLSVDAMDISGEHQLDVEQNVFKRRLDKFGKPVGKEIVEDVTTQADNNINASVVPLPPNYCGSCYGSKPDGECCNTCEEVREGYRKKGWSFAKPDGIEQCVREGFKEQLSAQKEEGCQVYGYLQVQKVAGNFHFAPGKSFQQHHMHVHDLQPFQMKNFNMSHKINRLSFGEEYPGIVNPLDGISKVATRNGSSMYQYFIKIVPTIYESYSGRVIDTNQFSVTDHMKAIEEGSHGLPGVFFMYDLSPIMVKFAEHRKSFPHFLTNVCAIIGGVFTVAGIIDSFIYHSLRSIEKKVEIGKNY